MSALRLLKLAHNLNPIQPRELPQAPFVVPVKHHVVMALHLAGVFEIVQGDFHVRSASADGRHIVRFHHLARIEKHPRRRAGDAARHGHLFALAP